MNLYITAEAGPKNGSVFGTVFRSQKRDRFSGRLRRDFEARRCQNVGAECCVDARFDRALKARMRAYF